MQCIDECRRSVTILQPPHTSLFCLLSRLFFTLYYWIHLFFKKHIFIIKEVQVHEFQPRPPPWLWASYITLGNLIICISTHWVTKCHPNLHAKQCNIWPKVDPEFWWWKMPSDCLLLWFINLALNKSAPVPTSIYLLPMKASPVCFSLPDLTCLNAIGSDRRTFSLCILT